MATPPAPEKPDLLVNGSAKAPCTIILAHGAGAAMDTEWMTTVAEGLAERYRVIRFEFPYMAQMRASGSRKPPNREPVLRETWLNVIAATKGPVVVGGKSMGGRIASMVADEAGVAGVACLGYPFHPPGKPERLRTAHLEDLRTPAIIVQGERDTFGNRDEVPGYSIASQITVHWVADGDHSLKPRKASGRTLDQNLAEAVETISNFVQERVLSR